MTFRILLPAEFQDIHRRAALAWVRRGHEFSHDEWRVAIRAFDLLKEAAVVTQEGILPFPAIYYRHVERPHADAFIQTLLDADKIEPTGTQAWAEVARNIPLWLRQVGLAPSHQPAARLLVAYCLYWWYAFAYGYTFEVEILRDLAQSGVQFIAHDLARRQERMSPWDLEVLGFRGDIKRSLFFLQTLRGRRLPYTFYIVRLTQARRSRTLIVMMRQAMWAVIDGETTLTTLSNLADVLPDTARVRISGVEVIAPTTGSGSAWCANANLVKWRVTMFEEAIDTISDREWEDAIAAHLAWGGTWHGDLPADTFFGIWASLAREARPLVVTVQLDTPEPTVTVPPGSPLTVEDNHILLDDGRELILRFES